MAEEFAEGSDPGGAKKAKPAAASSVPAPASSKSKPATPPVPAPPKRLPLLAPPQANQAKAPDAAPPAKPAQPAKVKPVAEISAPSLAELYPAPPAAAPVDLSLMKDANPQPPSYAVVLGQYVVKSDLNAAKKKLESTGVAPVVEQGARRKEPMTRIYLGEFADEQGAKKMTAKLQAARIESFTLKDKNGKRHIYSGSYHDQAAAEKERARFASLGIKADLKQVMVMVPTYLLTAGHFPTEEAARKKAAELEKLGLPEVAVQQLP